MARGVVWFAGASSSTQLKVAPFLFAGVSSGPMPAVTCLPAELSPRPPCLGCTASRKTMAGVGASLEIIIGLSPLLDDADTAWAGGAFEFSFKTTRLTISAAR